MANDVLQFVDSIASSPTVRLDLNDGTTWGAWFDGFDFSPPPLRRAINGTLLSDGSVQSASSYDNRVLTVVLDVLSTTVDLVATQIQTLNRELDRDTNYLKWQPNTATAPVFFRTLRSPASRIVEVPGSGTYKRFEVSILADPFALGLREDISIGTINNDPAAGAQGLFFDVTGVKGDVPVPVVIKDATALRAFGVMGTRQHGTPSDLPFFAQCESMTAGTDTTNPGGGPDAAMSGTGTNNFIRTSFATVATMATRVTWSLPTTSAARLALRGTYRIYACVRRSDNTSDMQLGYLPFGQNIFTYTVPPITIPKTTSRQLVELGLDNWGAGYSIPGKYAVEALTPAITLVGQASRTSGAGTLDWDFIMLVPADENLLIWDAAADRTTGGGIIDGNNEAVAFLDAAGNIFDGSTGVTLAATHGSVYVKAVGGFPFVKPNQTNRVIFALTASPSGGGGLLMDKTLTGSLTVSYWPRYLYIRPAST